MKKGLVTIIAVLVCLLIFFNCFIWINCGGKNALFSTAVSVLVFSFCLFVIERLNKDFSDLCREAVYKIDSATMDMMASLPFPSILFDENNRVLWYNKSANAFLENEAMLSSLNLVDGGSLTFGNCNYDYSVVNCGKDSVLRFVVFSDVTELKRVSERLEASKCVACYITVDNYSDVMNGISGNETGKLAIEIEDKMAELADSVSGVVHKLERDRFVLFMNMEYLVRLMADKFSFLSSVKRVKGSNDIPVTVSIGVGFSEKSVFKSGSYAKAAMELALGRGGDQAVVKIGDEFRFFGGSSMETEKKTRVRSRVMAQALCEIIRNSGQVLVMGHKSPDADSFGASVGIFRIAESLGVRARIVIDGSNTAVAREIEKLSGLKEYSSAFVSSDKALGIINEKTLIVVVDTHVASRCEAQGILNLTSKIVVIDHHRRSADFIKNTLLTYHEPSASSTCEMITEILQYTDVSIKISKHEAESLFAGLVLDTKNFTVRTGVRTFDAAAYLKKCGVDSGSVRELFKSDINSYKKCCEIVSMAESYRGITVISATSGTDIEVCARAADELLNIKGIKASFVILERGSNVHISARSAGEINVQIITEMLGGGGNLTAAGVQLEMTAEDALEKLKNTIDSYFAESY